MDIGVFIGPLAAGLAVVVSLYPPKTARAAHIWAAAFVVLGAISVVQEMQRSEHERQRDQDFAYLRGKTDAIALIQANASQEETKRMRVFARTVSEKHAEAETQLAEARAAAAELTPIPQRTSQSGRLAAGSKAAARPSPKPTARYQALKLRVFDLRSKILGLVEKYTKDSHAAWGSEERAADFERLKSEYLKTYRSKALAAFDELAAAIPEDRTTILQTKQDAVVPMPTEPMDIVDVAEWMNTFAGQLDPDVDFIPSAR